MVPCPVQRCDMIEIATGLFQCPWHGWGPSTQGFARYVAFHDVEIEGDLTQATFVEWLMYKHCYRLGTLAWAADTWGGRGLWENVLGYASVAEEWDPLPCPALSDVGKWEKLPNTPRLRPGMFKNTLGTKFLASGG